MGHLNGVTKMVLSTICSYSSGAKPDKNTITRWVPGDGFGDV